jgi:hypothetical protein
MRRILLAMLGFVAAPALAEQQIVPPPDFAEPLPPPPPGGLAISPDGRLVISSTLCAELRAAEAAAPSADYTPGVDVQGNAVAPADVPGSAPVLGADDFPIEIDPKLRQRFGVTPSSPFFHSRALLGLVTVRDGRALFNGAPIAENERAMMLAACAAAGR